MWVWVFKLRGLRVDACVLMCAYVRQGYARPRSKAAWCAPRRCLPSLKFKMLITEVAVNAPTLLLAGRRHGLCM